MAKKLFIGNLSYGTTDETLRAAFAPYGEIATLKIVLDRVTGRSRGFGFIEMVNAEDADKAISALHDQEVDGRKIIVREAEDRPRPQGDRPSFGGGRPGGNFGGNRGFGGGNRGFGGDRGFGGGNRGGDRNRDRGFQQDDSDNE